MIASSHTMKRRIYFVPITIFLNTFVFLAWQFTETKSFMPDHFLISYKALLEGRYWTLLTSVYSHSMGLHFFINMYVLHSFGGFLERFLGTWRFGLTYLICGIMGSLGHAFTSAFFLHNPSMAALGASGAIAGIIIIFSFCFPKEKILLLGIIPLPAIFGALLLIGLDLWGLYEQSVGSGLPIGHGAHLGGAFTGLFIYITFIKAYKERYLSHFWS